MGTVWASNIWAASSWAVGSWDNRDTTLWKDGLYMMIEMGGGIIYLKQL
jgi:hypothetical protein